MKKYIAIFFIATAGHSISFAQQGWIVAGGEAIHTAGSVSYTIGQPVYQTASHAAGLLIEGLQQPFAAGMPLSVHLLYFQAIANADRTATLQWTALSSRHTAYYTVERAPDAVSFHKLGTVDARNPGISPQRHSFLDLNPYEGDTYYRLQITDQEGKTSYSPLQKLRFGKQNVSIVAAPNPTRHDLQLMIKEMPADGLRYQITDMTGRILADQAITSQATTVDMSKLMAAPYLLQVTDNHQLLIRIKIIKQ